MSLLQRAGFRKKVLSELPGQLERLGIQGDQRRYLVEQLSQPDALKCLGQLTSPEEFQTEIKRWLEHPQHLPVGDPRITEGELVTAALILAVLRVSSPSQHQSLLTELLVSPSIQERFPTIGQAVQESRQRRKAPIGMAANDISQVLARAAQYEAKIITGADGKPKLGGEIRFDFKAGGENGKRMQEWFEQPHGDWVELDSQLGELSVSLGSEELDDLFLPGEATQLMFKLNPTLYRAKLKVIGKEKTKFLQADLLIQPGGGSRLILGHERCQVELLLSLSPEGHLRINVNLRIDNKGAILPSEDLDLLETFELLFSRGTRLQLVQYVNEQTGEKIESDETTIIFAPDSQPDDAARLCFGVQVQRLLTEVGKLISEQGFDPDDLKVPQMWASDAVTVMQLMLDTAYRRGIGQKMSFGRKIPSGAVESLKRLDSPQLVIGLTVDFGAAVVCIERSVTDYQVLSATEISNSDQIDVVIEGKWGDGEVRFLTTEEYLLEFGSGSQRKQALQALADDLQEMGLD
ncbi:hypothetical protein ACTQ9L_15960 [Deinococcus wulumuqiensis]